MAIRKRRKTPISEATVTMTVTLTSVIPTGTNDFDAAKLQAVKEAKRIEKSLKKMSGIDNVDIQRVKMFLRLEDE